MTIYTFTLQLDAPPTDDQIDRFFGNGVGDGLPGVTNGVGVVDFDREADTLAAAISSAIKDVEKVRGLHVTRVAPDELVTATEIAQRTGRSRESIRLLAAGLRGSGDFPAPAARVTGRSPLWRWSDVAAWAGTPDPDAMVIALINASLAYRRIAEEAPADLLAEVRPLLAAAEQKRPSAA